MGPGEHGYELEVSWTCDFLLTTGNHSSSFHYLETFSQSQRYKIQPAYVCQKTLLGQRGENFSLKAEQL